MQEIKPNGLYILFITLRDPQSRYHQIEKYTRHQEAHAHLCQTNHCADLAEAVERAAHGARVDATLVDTLQPRPHNETTHTE